MTSPIIEILRQNKERKSGEELGGILVKSLGKDLYGRVFNDFPAMMTNKQMESMGEAFKKILQTAEFDPVELTLGENTKKAVMDWYNNAVSLASMELLNNEGKLKSDLSRFLHLGNDVKEKLNANIPGILSSFVLNIAQAATSSLSKEISDKYAESFSAVIRYANNSFKDSYYKDFYNGIYGSKDFITQKNEIYNAGAKLVEIDKDIISQIKMSKNEKNINNYLGRKTLVESTIKLIESYKENEINPVELHKNLK